MKKIFPSLLFAGLFLVACTPPTAQAGSTSSSAEYDTYEACPVTLPPEIVFVPPNPYPAKAPYGNEFWFGTSGLWTALPPDGKWAQLQFGEKVFWWRDGYSAKAEPQPKFTVVARNLETGEEVTLDGPATNASHQDFGTAILTGVQLPAGGCWELTAQYRENALTFVVWVGP